MNSVVKKGMCILLIVTMMLGAQSALAATNKAGQAIDLMTPTFDEMLTETFSILFDIKDVTISKDEFLGKKGTIYFNFDKEKVLSLGESTYRTYEFKDENFFKMFVATICTAVDMHNIMDYGVKLYWVNNNKTELLSADEISQIGAQMATMFN